MTCVACSSKRKNFNAQCRRQSAKYVKQAVRYVMNKRVFLCFWKCRGRCIVITALCTDRDWLVWQTPQTLVIFKWLWRRRRVPFKTWTVLHVATIQAYSYSLLTDTSQLDHLEWRKWQLCDARSLFTRKTKIFKSYSHRRSIYNFLDNPLYAV